MRGRFKETDLQPIAGFPKSGGHPKRPVASGIRAILGTAGAQEICRGVVRTSSPPDSHEDEQALNVAPRAESGRGPGARPC